MTQHEKLRLRNVFVRQIQSFGDFDRKLGSGRGMALAERFANIVEQRAKIERHPTLDVTNHLRCERQLRGEFAALELLETRDRVKRMLVDGEHMIEIVLHARGTGRELRQKRPEHAEIV